MRGKKPQGDIPLPNAMESVNPDFGMDKQALHEKFAGMGQLPDINKNLKRRK